MEKKRNAESEFTNLFTALSSHPSRSIRMLFDDGKRTRADLDAESPLGITTPELYPQNAATQFLNTEQGRLLMCTVCYTLGIYEAGHPDGVSAAHYDARRDPTRGPGRATQREQPRSARG